MAGFVDLVRFNPTAGGTTDWTVSSAVAGCQTPALAGITNGTSYRYYAVSTDLTQWEIGVGAYNTGTSVLPRTTVLYNSSGSGTASGQSGAGTKINFSTIPQVSIVALAEDLLSTTAAVSDKTIYSNVSGGSAAPAFNNAATVGSSLVLIQRQTASSSATLDFTNAASFSNIYDEVLFVFRGLIPATNADNLEMRVSLDGGSTWKSGASDYDRCINQLSSAGTNTVTSINGENALTLTTAQSNNVGRPMGGELRIFSPWDALLDPVTFMMGYFDGTNYKMLTGGGFYTAAGPINGIRFFFVGGNIASGTIAQYGVRNA